MKYRIICVGKVKEPFYRDQIQLYISEIEKHCPINIIELSDEKTGENLSDAERKRILDIEGQRILQALTTPLRDYIVPLCIDGKAYETAAWKRRVVELAGNKEYEQITYIIGGSLGLSEQVVRCGKEKLSFSSLTFPHQLMRVMLLEQILYSV